jgi:hypothetical protein
MTSEIGSLLRHSMPKVKLWIPSMKNTPTNGGYSQPGFGILLYQSSAQTGGSYYGLIFPSLQFMRLQ